MPSNIPETVLEAAFKGDSILFLTELNIPETVENIELTTFDIVLYMLFHIPDTVLYTLLKIPDIVLYMLLNIAEIVASIEFIIPEIVEYMLFHIPDKNDQTLLKMLEVVADTAFHEVDTVVDMVLSVPEMNPDIVFHIGDIILSFIKVNTLDIILLTAFIPAETIEVIVFHTLIVVSLQFSHINIKGMVIISKAAFIISPININATVITFSIV
jgi:hypothetical protein